jgi:hypothetical protein
MYAYRSTNNLRIRQKELSQLTDVPEKLNNWRIKCASFQYEFYFMILIIYQSYIMLVYIVQQIFYLYKLCKPSLPSSEMHF